MKLESESVPIVQKIMSMNDHLRTRTANPLPSLILLAGVQPNVSLPCFQTTVPDIHVCELRMPVCGVSSIDADRWLWERDHRCGLDIDNVVAADYDGIHMSAAKMHGYEGGSASKYRKAGTMVSKDQCI